MRASLTLAAMLAGALSLACSSTGPDEVATIQITLPSGLLIGDTVTAEVVLLDGVGNIIEGRPITFTSSAPTVASVSSTGLVTGLAAGGPASIRAAAGPVEASVNVTVRDDPRFGYAWASDATSATYTPSAEWRFNSSGGGITITRSAAGTYAVRFAGLGQATGQRENVQVTSYIELAYCGTGGWETQGSDLIVNVRCFAPGGAPMDSRYTVLVVGARALEGRLGFAHADQPGQSSYRPALAHNSAFGAATITRTGTGTYRADFSGLARGTGGPEMVMVTHVGTAANRCVVEVWELSGFWTNITCTDQSGAQVDAQFSLLVIERGRAGQRTAFAWTHQPAAANYTPDPTYSLNSGGGAITALRSGTGTYRIDFENFIKGTGTETVVITAYGAANRFCRVGGSGWSMNTATTFRVNVACTDPSGAPADSQYDIIVIQ